MPRIYPIAFIFSIALAVSAAVALGVYGLNFGVDFTGGSVLEVEFENGRPEVAQMRARFEESSNGYLHGLVLTPVDERGLIIRSSDRSHMMHSGVWLTINQFWPESGVKQLSFDFVGPAIGNELKAKSIRAIIILILVVVAYIAFVFRGMSRVLSPWAMGLAALLALFHDLIIPMGVFAVLGKVSGVQITVVFVAAILTVLGYSLSDTVVVFDRVRENILKGTKEPFGRVVHQSVLQTLVRSLNTTLTTLAALVAIWLFGGETLRYFALALIIGISLGSYSSIFVASPVLVWLSRRRTGR